MNNIEIINKVIKQAMAKGADNVEVIILENSSLSASVRMGNVESIENSESSALGLRFIKGYKSSILSTNDLNEESVSKLVEKASYMTDITPQDEYLTVAEAQDYAQEIPNLDLYDSEVPHIKTLIDKAVEAEDIALSFNKITNSNGSEASNSRTNVVFATSQGFCNSYRNSNSGLSVSVVAQDGDAMETDYDYSSVRHYNDLMSAKMIGRNAAQKAINKLHSRQVISSKLPVIFDAKIANSLLSSFASAVNGSAIARNTSFLRDKLHQSIFKQGINIYDNPLINRGLGSKPFDGEGVACQKLNLVENGILNSWIMDLRSAKQLGFSTTASASRSLTSPPSPAISNLYMEAGKISRQDLIKSVNKGIYITDLFGMGVNIITGDYSQGAFGFMIENGEITYPISEFTIASNLKDIFMNIIPANDLEFHYRINSPTLLIENMTIAGA